MHSQHSEGFACLVMTGSKRSGSGEVALALRESWHGGGGSDPLLTPASPVRVPAEARAR